MDQPGGKWVMLRLDGDLASQGFRVDLEIGLEGKRPFLELQGQLPPAPELLTALQQWQYHYRSLGSMSRIVPKGIVYGGSVNRLEGCRQAAEALRNCFTQWIDSESFRLLDKRLREDLQRDEPIRVLIRSQDFYIRHLPWCLWDLVDRYPQCEIALSAPSFEQQPLTDAPTRTQSIVKILAILGNRDGIDVEADRQLLESLPNAAVTVLVEPHRQQINDQLWQQRWDILFFAGHSGSQPLSTPIDRHPASRYTTFAPDSLPSLHSSPDGPEISSPPHFDCPQGADAQTGYLSINEQDFLTLEELKFGLRRAIAQGLQLAIFNSCDGLGLAKALENLQIPQVVVMREPVPDRVAQEFLKAFLNAFANGEPLYLSARQARERLQGIEDEFLCASWLPVICQHPMAIPPTWSSLQGLKPDSEPAAEAEKSLLPLPPLPQESPQKPLQRWLQLSRSGRIQAALLTSLLVTSAVLGVRSLGFLQSFELFSLDHLMQLRPAEPADPRIVVISIDEADIQYQDRLGMKRQSSLSDQALTQLITKLKRYSPRVLGLDIYHDFEFSPELKAVLAQQSQQNSWVAICEVAKTPDNATGVSAPPQTPPEHLGFSDIPVDPGYLIRRQLLGMSSSATCPTSQSFSLRIALQYLQQQGVTQMQRDAETGELQINGAVFPQMTYQAGGYHLSTHEAKGYQILLNYRSSYPSHISLTSLLEGMHDRNLAELVQDRIVLIGVADDKDAHFTPYQQGTLTDRVPGVMIQAQMVSQIISAVLDRRPLLWWWPEWAETLWILGWAAWGGLLGLWSRSQGWLGWSLGLSASLLGGLCLLLLISGGWVPLVPAAIALLGTGGIVHLWQTKPLNSENIEPREKCR